MTITQHIEAHATDVYERYRPRLLEILRRRIDPAFERRASADDIVQSALTRALERSGERPDAMAPFPWLYRIVMDCYYDEWRKHNRVSLGGLKREVPWPERSSAQLAGSFTSPSEALARDEQVTRVRQVMEALSEEDERVLTMRVIEGLTFQEMGEVLEVKLNRAAYLFSRAMRRFQKVWQQLGRGGKVGS